MIEMNENKSDEEWEEEEVLILAEISGVIDKEMLNLKDKSCKILGLETEEPILQIGEVFFAGDHDESVGTSVIFKETKEESDNSKNLEYLNLTTKKIKFKRVFLKEREWVDANKHGPENITNSL